MAIGRRIYLFRRRRGLKQKELGQMLGFSASTSEARITQYEKETRIPKSDLIRRMAEIFQVRPEAIAVPEMDTVIGMMHTLFAMEDEYALEPDYLQGELCIRFDWNKKDKYSIYKYVNSWYLEQERLRKGEITKEEYDNWRYNFPDTDTHNIWVKIPEDK